jgi:hypothetical protein
MNNYTVEEFVFGPAGSETVYLTVNVSYGVDPGEAEVRYDRNGSGCPASPGGIEDVICKVVHAQFAEDEVSVRSIYPTDVARLAEVQAEFDRQFDKDENNLRTDITEACEADANDQFESRDDDGDERYERERDMRDERRYAGVD